MSSNPISNEGKQRKRTFSWVFQSYFHLCSDYLSLPHSLCRACTQMPQVTRELLRKRAEHNEGMISTLEEISLHQEELESINEVLGKTCRKLKILYLQNNIISVMENLNHMKDLEYLNLALNNIKRIEGLQNCEFLRKLDLTVNFIDVETLKESIEHLQSRSNLQELYMMGNPAQANWPDFNSYVIAKLPQLQMLDGTEISKSMRIVACQMLPRLEEDLHRLVEEKKPRVVELPARSSEATVEDVDEEAVGEDNDPNELTENTPETRVKIYKELAQQKKEKEDRANVNAPRQRDIEGEHSQSISAIRKREAELDSGSEVKQKNEGAWEFFWDEESKPGYILLDVRVAKYLDSSLIDVDIHPHYVSIVIKSKLLRLRLPAEVSVAGSKCQRSKSTGALLVIMPKTDPRANAVTIRGDIKDKAQQQARQAQVGKPTDAARTKVKAPKAPSLQELMMAEAATASASTSSAALLSPSPAGSITSMLQVVRTPAAQPSSEDVSLGGELPPAPASKLVGIEELD